MTHILPVLWLMSCFHIMGQMQIQAIGELFTVTWQVAPLNCTPGAKSANPIAMLVTCVRCKSLWCLDVVAGYGNLIVAVVFNILEV